MAVSTGDDLLLRIGSAKWSKSPSVITISDVLKPRLSAGHLPTVSLTHTGQVFPWVFLFALSAPVR